MSTSPEATFDRNYALHLQHLTSGIRNDPRTDSGFVVKPTSGLPPGLANP